MTDILSLTTGTCATFLRDTWYVRTTQGQFEVTGTAGEVVAALLRNQFATLNAYHPKDVEEVRAALFELGAIGVATPQHPPKLTEIGLVSSVFGLESTLFENNLELPQLPTAPALAVVTEPTRATLERLNERALSMVVPTVFWMPTHPIGPLIIRVDSSGACLCCVLNQLEASADDPELEASFLSSNAIYSPLETAQLERQAPRVAEALRGEATWNAWLFEGDSAASHKVAARQDCSACTGRQPAVAIQDLDQALTALTQLRFGVISGAEPLFNETPLPGGLVCAFAEMARPRLDPAVRDTPREGLQSAGVGRSTVDAMLRAKMEAVERYACSAGPAVGVTKAPATDLEAVYPIENFTLYETHQYESDGFPFSPFDPQVPRLFLKTENMSCGGEVQVPLDFFVYPVLGDHPAVVSSSSNGAAAHINREAAIRGGLLELIERDALLVTWLGKRIPERIDPQTLPPTVQDVIAYLGRLGQRVSIINLTVDLGIFTAGAIAQSADGGWPALLLGAASHPDPQIAVTKAVDEVLIQTLAVLDEGPDAAPQAEDMYTVMDHRAFYLKPDNSHLWAFLLNGPEVALPPKRGESSVEYLVDHLASHGVDVLVGELTCRELLGTPIRVFKVLTPQLQPLYFDGRRKRIARHRLQQNGCDPYDINPAPHPLA